MKTKLVEIIRSQGFDFVSACEYADKVIAETKASSKPETRWHIGRVSFTLRKGGTQ